MLRLWTQAARVLLMLAMTVAGSQSLGAAVLFVDTLADELNSDGDCSLREALQGANSDSAVDDCAAGLGSDLIIVPGSGTLLLTLGPMVVTGAVEVQLSNDVVLDAAYASRIFEIAMSNDEDDFSLKGGTLTRGHTTDRNGGGAILVDDVNEFTVEGVAFVDNRTCDLVVVTACFVDPDDSDTPPGGAISFVRDNTLSQVDRVRIKDASFVGNTASGSGGAVATKTLVNSGSFIILDVLNSRFENNRSAQIGGGLRWYAAGEVTLSDTSFVLNTADRQGAFNLWGTIGANEKLSMVNVLVTDNTAASGAATALFHEDGEVWFSSFLRNTTTDPEGAAAVSITAAADHIVIADNEGGDCVFSNSLTSTGYNFDSDGSCGFDHALDLPSASVPMTGPMNFGGRILSLPTPSSPVVDGGVPLANCLGPDGGFTDTDLRGEIRSAAATGGVPTCDIGAIERQPEESLLFADGFERGDTLPWQ